MEYALGILIFLFGLLCFVCYKDFAFNLRKYYFYDEVLKEFIFKSEKEFMDFQIKTNDYLNQPSDQTLSECLKEIWNEKKDK